MNDRNSPAACVVTLTSCAEEMAQSRPLFRTAQLETIVDRLCTKCEETRIIVTGDGNAIRLHGSKATSHMFLLILYKHVFEVNNQFQLSLDSREWLEVGMGLLVKTRAVMIRRSLSTEADARQLYSGERLR